MVLASSQVLAGNTGERIPFSHNWVHSCPRVPDIHTNNSRADELIKSKQKLCPSPRISQSRGLIWARVPVTVPHLTPPSRPPPDPWFRFLTWMPWTHWLGQIRKLHFNMIMFENIDRNGPEWTQAGTLLVDFLPRRMLNTHKSVVHASLLSCRVPEEVLSKPQFIKNDHNTTPKTILTCLLWAFQRYLVDQTFWNVWISSHRTFLETSCIRSDGIIEA